MSFEALKAVPTVNISSQGLFKYILIIVKDGDFMKTVVRGFADCWWHADILGREQTILGWNLSAECIGGGRIVHIPLKKRIMLYGSSQQFGKANHRLTRSILQKQYPDYKIQILDVSF